MGGGEAAGHTALRRTAAAAAAMPDCELRKALNFEVYPTRGVLVMMRDNGRCSVSVWTFGVFELKLQLLLLKS